MTQVYLLKDLTSGDVYSQPREQATFDRTILDNDAAYNFSTNILTVPAGWNNRIGYINLNYFYDFTRTGDNFAIERSTDGGSVWDQIAIWGADSTVFGSYVAGPAMLFQTGHQYRFYFEGETTATTAIPPTALNNAAIILFPETTLTAFGNYEMTGQFIANDATVVPTLGTVIYESASHRVDSNTAIQVPAGSGESWMHVVTGAASATTEPDAWTVRIQKSTNSGGDWTTISYTTALNVRTLQLDSMVSVSAGDWVHVDVTASSSTGQTLIEDSRSFVSFALFARDAVVPYNVTVNGGTDNVINGVDNVVSDYTQ